MPSFFYLLAEVVLFSSSVEYQDFRICLLILSVTITVLIAMRAKNAKADMNNFIDEKQFNPLLSKAEKRLENKLTSLRFRLSGWQFRMTVVSLLVGIWCFGGAS